MPAGRGGEPGYILILALFSESEGWENPFQPEGEVSQDADYILRLWKGGNLTQVLS